MSNKHTIAFLPSQTFEKH